MKTKEEIRATTGRIPKPANYKYGEKLKEWDASLTAGQEHALARLNPINDRIVVKLLAATELNETSKGVILLTDEKPLIGGDCRPVVVLKCGPGKWIEGDWWKIDPATELAVGTVIEVNSAGWWMWYPGQRRPMSVKPGQTVYIGNWVDLEADGLALCQEADVRGIVAGENYFLRKPLTIYNPDGLIVTAKKRSNNERTQTAQNVSHRKAQVSEGRNKRGAGRRARISYAAKTL